MNYSEGKSEEIITTPEIITIENQKFLKNRNNDITNILFFENGDIFITEIARQKIALSWDRNFTNKSVKKLEGKLTQHSEKHLTQYTVEEIIIYQLTTV
jgi:hypothetical protein